MASMTPIKIRGKRGATADEKSNASKKRWRGVRDDSYLSPSLPSVISAQDAKPSVRKRKRRTIELSRLEQLPSEILQEIFECSKNISLPFASPELMSQLSDRHVCLQLTTQILEPVLRGRNQSVLNDAVVSQSDMAAASRLFNCKFMTWPFFRSWLDAARERFSNESFTKSPANEGDVTAHYCWTWGHLGPADGLLPPIKVLHGPWTDDRVNLLRVLTYHINSLPEESPVLGEAAFKGLGQAISASNVKAVETLLDIGIRPTTELLRHALTDIGCGKDIALLLLDHGRRSKTINFLDPALWAWAERARAEGNEKGSWLLAMMKKLGCYSSSDRKTRSRQTGDDV